MVHRRRRTRSAAGGAGYRYTIGARIGTDLEQVDHAKLIIIWGGNWGPVRDRTII